MSDKPFAAYVHLSTPTIITDPGYRIVYINPAAERFWQVKLSDVVGTTAAEALRMEAPDGRDISDWAKEIGYPSVASGDPFTCRTKWSGGRQEIIRLSAARFYQDDEWYTLMTVLSDTDAETRDWALTDPLTTLFNRHQWEREFADRNARRGVVIFLDLDNLKQINDFKGHRRGDEALIATGKAMRLHAPDGSLAIRYGGDEFVLVLDHTSEDAAKALAERIVANVAAAMSVDPGMVPVHLSYGVAAYEPGDLPGAVERADEALYEQKGVLLRGAGGGRIFLTGEARGRVLYPSSDPQRAAGEFSRGFGAQFDGYFRRAYAAAISQAKDFVQFAAPRAGSAAVEVGAGSGRNTFDGGLADAVGAQGQLLVTDPSQAQLQVARQRAESLGLSWVRFLVAPAEHLPLVSNSVDLVIGSTFLHFTDEGAAIRSMSRIVRPGGRVALCAGLRWEYGPAWGRALEPVLRTLEKHGLSYRDPCLPEEELLGLFHAAGLVVEGRRTAAEASAVFPSAEVAVGVARQARLATLLLRRVPDSEWGDTEGEFELRLRQAVEDLGVEAAYFRIPWIYLVARKPG